MSEKRRIHREFVGLVLSDKMNKTRVVEVRRSQTHAMYRKKQLKFSRIYVHDEKNESKTGDLVRAVSTRPISKTKHFRMAAVLERGAAG